MEELAQGVLGPLVLGGTMRLVAPFGPKLALGFGADRRIVDDDLRTRIDVARVRQVRLVAPVDVLPDVSPAEWALVAALNDLLQSTNHEMSSMFTRGRHRRLLASADDIVRAVPRPTTALELLCRHATFARMMNVIRTDTRVELWSGSLSYRGAPVPPFVWPRLRRVEEHPKKVPMEEMPEGIALVSMEDYQGVLANLLTRTPLTDIATMHRDAPLFNWSHETLATVASDIGRTVALRAALRAPHQGVVRALRAANERLEPRSHLRAIADAFAADFLSRATGAVETPSAAG
jgi:hypothetical protein